MTTTEAPLRIVHSEASTGWGGQELRILTEAAGMRRRGHDVHLVCPRNATIFEQARRRGIPVTALPIGKRNLAAVRALRSWLVEHRADVLNTHSSTDSWLAAVTTRTIGPKIPIVRTRHISTTIGRGPVTRWLYIRGADRVVTTGEQLRRTLIEDNRFPANHVISVPTGVDTELFSPGDMQAARRAQGLPADKTIVGIVATIRTWKGHRYLLDAVQQLGREDLLVLIVGDGPIRHLVQQQVIEQKLEACVRMVGQQDDVAPWLRTMDIFALPSYANEGVPQGIVQAMSCGLPVISTPIGAIQEAVLDGQTGLIVSSREPAPLAEALTRLIENPALRQQFGRLGRQRAIDIFGIERMLDRMEQVFQEAVGRQPRRQRAA